MRAVRYAIVTALTLFALPGVSFAQDASRGKATRGGIAAECAQIAPGRGSTQQAQSTDAFLKIDGVDGDAAADPCANANTTDFSVLLGGGKGNAGIEPDEIDNK